MAKKINMHFDPNGGVKIEAEGYDGGTCIDATAPFEALFATEVAPRQATGECAPAAQERVNTN